MCVVTVEEFHHLVDRQTLQPGRLPSSDLERPNFETNLILILKVNDDLSSSHQIEEC